MSFDKKWAGSDSRPLGKAIRETIIPPEALKSRMDFAHKKVQAQIQKLERESQKFAERGKILLAKVVDAYQKHDTPHANIYANELAELRKMQKTTLNAKLARTRAHTNRRLYRIFLSDFGGNL